MGFEFYSFIKSKQLQCLFRKRKRYIRMYYNYYFIAMKIDVGSGQYWNNCIIFSVNHRKKGKVLKDNMIWRLVPKTRSSSNIFSSMRSFSTSSTTSSSVESGGSSFLQRFGAFLSGVGLTSLYGIYILQEENKKINKSLQEIKVALGK